VRAAIRGKLVNNLVLDARLAEASSSGTASHDGTITVPPLRLVKMSCWRLFPDSKTMR
jgi:hypothetical protein